MATFEHVFKIAPGHVLKEVRGHHNTLDDDWRHEEYNADGELIARYESWHYLRPNKSPANFSGWLKYSSDGTLLEKHDDLPL
jgi:hypothetical protein